MSNGEEQPKSGAAVCELVLKIIENAVAKHSHPRMLPDICQERFRNGDDPKHPEKANAKSFTEYWDGHPGAWEQDEQALRRAARLHGALCNAMQDFFDKGQATQSITPETFKQAGAWVKALCPPPPSTGVERGAWCSWP